LRHVTEIQRTAAVLTDEPDRRLWHVAASTVGPDESVARDVEVLSVRLARRGAMGAAIAAARRAAALSELTGPRRDRRGPVR
jgi:hypothetical protein